MPKFTMLSEPTVTVLGPDPTNRRCRINCYAFQQDAIASFNGWQYVAFYSPLNRDTPEPLYVHLARRHLPRGRWDVLVFEDYPQTVDDGHNTVQLGICPGDGTIHLSYDHHCDILRYRHSVPSLASNPTAFTWSSSLFTQTLPNLPGLPPSHTPFHYVTYPRFLPLRTTGSSSRDDGSLLFTLRDGKAGLGNDHLYIYTPASPSHRSSDDDDDNDSQSNSAVQVVMAWQYKYVGQYLTGLRSNPYVHGLTHRDSNLHVTWVYRGFVPYEGWDDPLDAKHKQQAGPNGAENNHDICYAYSPDGGLTWRNGEGKVIADMTILQDQETRLLREEEDDNKKGGSVNEMMGSAAAAATATATAATTITNKSEGIVAVEIGKGSGLTNQEAQAVDMDGGVHVLNRDDVGQGDDGEVVWKQHYRNPGTGKWSSRPIRPIYGSTRGRLAVGKAGDLYIILPDAERKEMRILKTSKESGYTQDEEVWVGRGLTGEPLVDERRMEEEDVLSLMVLADEKKGQRRNVVVLDFQL